MAEQTIKEGYQVFAADGDVAFGAVLHAPERGAEEFTIYVEDAGEFLVPMSAVSGVHSQKVVLNTARLDEDLKQAIRHAHDDEDDADHEKVEDED